MSKNGILKFFVFVLIVFFIVSLSFIGCKATTTTTAAATTAAETTAAATTAAETAAATTTTVPKVKKALMVSIPVGIAPIWDLAYNSFVEECKKLGIDGSFQAPTEVKEEQQALIMETAIGEGSYDAIVSVPWAVGSFEAIYKLGEEKGVIFFEVPQSSKTKSKAVIGYAGTDPVSHGIEAANQFAKLGIKKGKVLVVSTAEGTALQDGQVESLFTEATKLGLDFTQSARIFTLSDMDKGIDLAKSAFIANPEINLVYCTDGGGASSVVKAMEELKIPYDNIKILAIDMPQQTYDLIKQGKVWATLNQNGDKWGSVPAQQLAKYWKEGKIEYFTDTKSTFYDINNLADFPTDTYKLEQ